MSNFMERISGKSEQALMNKVAELESKLSETTQQLEQVKAENANLNSKLNANADLINNQRFQIENLQSAKNSIACHRDDLAKQLDSEQRAHKFDTEKIQRELTAKIEELTAKIKDLAAHNEELTAQNNALQRSVEISRPENQIPDCEIPCLDDFIEKRQSLYDEYARAQEHAIKECIQQAVAENRTPVIDLINNPSFTYVKDDHRCTFVCEEVLSKLMGEKKSDCSVSGWAPFLKLKKSAMDQVSDIPISELEDLVAHNYFPFLSREDFFRSTAVESEYGRDNTVLTTWTACEFQIVFVLNGRYY